MKKIKNILTLLSFNSDLNGWNLSRAFITFFGIIIIAVVGLKSVVSMLDGSKERAPIKTAQAQELYQSLTNPQQVQNVKRYIFRKGDIIVGLKTVREVSFSLYNPKQKNWIPITVPEENVRVVFIRDTTRYSEIYLNKKELIWRSTDENYILPKRILNSHKEVNPLTFDQYTQDYLDYFLDYVVLYCHESDWEQKTLPEAKANN